MRRSGLLIGAEDVLIPPRADADTLGAKRRQRGIEAGVVLARADHHWHWYRVAKDERLLARVERRQDGTQVRPAAHTGKHRVDVALVVQLAGDARANLRQDLGIDATRTLVHHQEGDVEFAELAGNGAK